VADYVEFGVRDIISFTVYRKLPHFQIELDSDQYE